MYTLAAYFLRIISHQETHLQLLFIHCMALICPRRPPFIYDIPNKHGWWEVQVWDWKPSELSRTGNLPKCQGAHM